MYKLDITQQSKRELSLLVFNTESLYSIRQTFHFIDVIKDLYIYTDEQLEVLEQDLRDEEAEA